MAAMIKHRKNRHFDIKRPVAAPDESADDRAAKDAAINEFLRKNKVKKCPTKYLAPVR